MGDVAMIETASNNLFSHIDLAVYCRGLIKRAKM